MATPTLPTSPKESWWSESRPIWVGRSKATERPGLAVLREVLEAPVGLPGGPEARVLAHRPGPAAVHRGVGPAGVGILPRVPQLLGVLEASRSGGP
jgi:hypothetical protein